MGSSQSQPDSNGPQCVVRLDRSLFSDEAVLKACYWFSREFSCEIASTDTGSLSVTIASRSSDTQESPNSIKDKFLKTVTDFALREKIEVKTSAIRDLLLAKAFSESGILEDEPKGIFGDRVEEENPKGMFKILNSPGQ
jgi:His-Xaa-Ser system protein HxsD